MGKNKKPLGEPAVHREKYKDSSARFKSWVEDISLEKTFLGRWFFSLDKRYALRRWLALFVFSLGLAALVVIDIDTPYDLTLGDTARRDYRSPFSFEITDRLATQEKRDLAETSQPPFFDYAPHINSDLSDRFREAFRHMRLEVFKLRGKPVSDLERALLLQRSEFEGLVGRPIGSETYQWLIRTRFSTDVERLIGQLLEYWGSEKLISGLNDYVGRDQRLIAIRDIQQSETRTITVSKHRVRDLLVSEDFNFSTFEGYSDLTTRGQREVDRLVRGLLLPNLTLNKKETETRKDQAKASILPVVISIKEHRPFLREGQTVQPIHLQVVNEIKRIRAEKRHFLTAFSSALLLTLLIMVSYAFIRRITFKKVKVDNKDFFLIATVTMFTTLLVKLFFFLTGITLVYSLGQQIPSNFFLYLAPVAVGAMMVGLLITAGELVWLYIIFQAVVLSFMVESRFTFFVVVLLGGVTAARAVFGCHSRTDVYKAGFLVGAIQAVAIICFNLLQGKGVGLSDLYYNIPAGLASGILSALITMMFLPLLENMFNVTTDVKLLELSNLNHPLMKQMVVKAPGTYHHSLIVGALCEAAGEEIGANPLLAKVMAYYHDIGKMDHAQYFIENQRPEHNPHDHISPYMSKTILIAHVKDGAEMAMQHNLGKPIVDGILQHHGTTLISYFYNRALENQDEDVDLVNEEDFRYPGPKPQFKEAALVMLADTVEAAARTLEEPTPSRIQNLVKTLIHRKFADGQLDECNLTLKELTVIERCFNRVLLGVYHHRVDYPSGKSGSQGTTGSMVRIPNPRSGRGPVTA